jgi:hypothetical protein
MAASSQMRDELLVAPGVWSRLSREAKGNGRHSPAVSRLACCVEYRTL